MTRTITGLFIIFTLAALGCAERRGQETLTPIQSTISVSGGLIEGKITETGLRTFMSVPYAAPPVGELRWAPTASVIPWEGVLLAKEAGPACMQPEGLGGDFYGETDIEMDEDCLLLNVWTRAKNEEDQLPVMVWIHGGGLVIGQGSTYPGDLLTSKGVVLVTVNYRLGRFGFFAHPELTDENPNKVSGNQGLRDQIASLKWVRDNIERFGGDPDNVTIFGESAGSLSMSLLQASPLAKGLFHKVIGESGGAFQPMTYRDQVKSYSPMHSEAIGEKFGRALNEEGEDISLEEMRGHSQEELMTAFNSDPIFSDYNHLAIVDGEVIPEEVATIFGKGLQADVPVMIGSNSDEGTAFMPFFYPLFGEGVEGFQNYVASTSLSEMDKDEIAREYPSATDEQAEDSWAQLFADEDFTYPMRAWARSMENVSSDAYLYWFTWVPPVENSEQLGSFHAAELGYVFGNLTLFGAKPTEADQQFSEMMSTIWTQFAKTGNPNGPGLPEWTPYTSDNEAYVELGINTGPRSELRIAQIDLIESAWKKRRSQQ